MDTVTIGPGYDVPIAGGPKAEVAGAVRVRRVGVRPAEFDLRPRVLVEEGDTVQAGQPLFQDKARPEVVFVAPMGGKVFEVVRGDRRKLLRIGIEIGDGQEPVQHDKLDLTGASREQVRDYLLAGGAWPLLRQHPYAKVPHPGDVPKSIFVSAMPTEPWHPDPHVALRGQEQAFQVGLDTLAKLTDGPVHLTWGAAVAEPAAALKDAQRVEKHLIKGPHPAGSAAVQAFYIDRVKPGQVVWYLGVQDVVTVGKLVRDGRWDARIVVSLAGNAVAEQERQYYETVRGVQIDELAGGKVQGGAVRFVSGGVLCGSRVDADSYLGYGDDAVAVLPDEPKREVIGWLLPGRKKHSWSNAFLSALAGDDETFEMDTRVNGGRRACIQSTYCNVVCPTDVKPLYVWKAVSYGDIEEAEALGIQDCVSCGLCTYVCPSKIEIGQIIEQGLQVIQKEG